jgi:hypothetical protein
MKSTTDLKELWKKQETAIPDTKELFEKINIFKRKNLYALILTNLALLFTSFFICFIWYYFKPETITTKIGIVLAVMAMALYLFVYNRMIPLLVRVGYDMNSSQCLQQLLKFKEKQIFLQNIALNIYFPLLSTGIFLYMLEYTFRMKLPWSILSYIITFSWIAIIWFYFMPRTVRKQQVKINELIDKFDALGRQLTTDE